MPTFKRIVSPFFFKSLSSFPGIKFIPLRTPGGELIPESGLFVQIKKKKLSSLTQQPEEDSPQVNGSETLNRADSTEQYFGDVDVTASIHPSLLKQRAVNRTAKDSSDSARPLSSPPMLESHLETAEEEASWKSKLDELVRESRTGGGGREKQLEVVAEVHGDENKSEKTTTSSQVVTVTLEPHGNFDDDGTGVMTVPFESAQEFHLEFSIPDSDQ